MVAVCFDTSWWFGTRALINIRIERLTTVDCMDSNLETFVVAAFQQDISFLSLCQNFSSCDLKHMMGKWVSPAL